MELQGQETRSTDCSAPYIESGKPIPFEPVSSLFGPLQVLQQAPASTCKEQGEMIQKFDEPWLNLDFSRPTIPGGIRDWLQQFALVKGEDYLIDPRVGTVWMGIGWETRADIDASAVLLDEAFNVVDVVWYRKWESTFKSVVHSGDNKTGEGDGDDEVITVVLDSVPLQVHHILFTVNVYSYNVSFEDVDRAYVRMMHGKAKYRQRMMCQLSLTDMTGNALLLGHMTRKGAYWNFRALGAPASGRTVQELLRDPQNLECLHQCPSFYPDFRQISVRVIKGTKLAPKDAPGLFRREATSDPYYLISYKKKTFASRRKDRTLNPEWDEPPFSLGAVTEAEPKAVKITIFDYDALSADDFMGIVKIPASVLYNAGVGTHLLTLPLGPSKKEVFRDEEVSGDIQIEVNVHRMP